MIRRSCWFRGKLWRWTGAGCGRMLQCVDGWPARVYDLSGQLVPPGHYVLRIHVDADMEDAWVGLVGVVY